jgi:hypothetical protein
MQKLPNEIQSKKQRSTSVLVKDSNNNNNNVNQSEKENTNNSNTNYKKGFHHRKRTSSYFLGSYIPKENILENNQTAEEDINTNLNINLNLNNNFFDNNNEPLNDKEEETTSNEIKNKLIYNYINNDNSNNNISISFPSYDESNNNNNSVIIKQDDSSAKKNKSNSKKENSGKNENDKYDKNSIFYEMAKNSENSTITKSFISFKNSLKYIKDKDERTTPSYQLALQTDKKSGNNNYVTSSNIIEEEKSSMMESKSEFSNKKDYFFFEKKKLENNKDEKNNNNENTKENNASINININNQNLGNNKMSLALNEIIIKNNKKEENRRKYLTKNKMTLLNTFFTMSKTVQKNEEKSNNRNKMENYAVNKDKQNDKDLVLPKEKEKIKEYKKLNEDRNNLDYFNKKKFVSKFLKKSIANKRPVNCHANTENTYLNSMQNLNNNLNLNLNCPERFTINSQTNQDNLDNNNIENINNNLKKNSYKIPHLSNVKKKFNQKLISETGLIETPFKKLKTSNTTNANYLSSRQDNNLRNTNNIIKARNFHTLQRIENLNNALSFIREKKKINKANSNLNFEKKKYIKNNTCNFSNIKNTKPSGYSTSFLTNSNSNTNTQSHSQSREKKKPPKFLRKANSGSFNSKGEYLSQSGDDISGIETNKEQIVMCLKNKLCFGKLYEKIDALEKINSTNFSNKSFFLILCDIKINQFIFSGLYKYYIDKERYIKIYGDERSPNYILLKDIKGKIKYKIFEYNNGNDTSTSSFVLINHFRFTSNAIIIIKN